MHASELQDENSCVLVTTALSTGNVLSEFAWQLCRNAEIEAQIAHLRAELLHKEQENDRVQLQLTQEKEERERAQRKVIIFTPVCLGHIQKHLRLQNTAVVNTTI